MSGFKPPKVRRGDIVMWYMNGVNTSEGHVAIVTSLGVQSMVGLRIFPEDTERVLFKTGVRYVGDPSAKEGELRMSGAWETMEEYDARLLEREFQQQLAKERNDAARGLKPAALQPA